MADDKKPASKKIVLPQQGESGFPAERNLMIVFVLMGLMLLVTPYFTPQPPPEPPKKDAPAKAAAPTPAPVKPAEKQPDKPGEKPASAIAAAQPENFSIDTPVYRIVFSNTGGTVVSWQLKKYKDSKGKPLELVNPKALVKVDAPFSLALPKNQDLTYVNKKLFAHKMLPDGNALQFDYADAQVRVTKTFRVAPNDYRVQVSSEVMAGGAAAPHNLNWRGGFGDLAAFNAAAFGHTVHFDSSAKTSWAPWAEAGSLVIAESKEALENQPKVANGVYEFAGIDDPYFAAVFLPVSGAKALEHRTYVDTVLNYEGKEEKLIGTSVGGDGRNEFTMFVGPKEIEALDRVNPKLGKLIQWGDWFGWLAKPMFYWLRMIHDWVKLYIPEGSWGWAIVLVTVIINFAMLPFKVSSLRSSKKMAAIKPEIDKINKKYEGVTMGDPRNQKKGEEMMALYQKHKINPAGGCVPLLIQLPFLIALLSVLTVTIDLRQAKWLWVSDLSQPETLAIRILPVLMVASQFILSKMTPAAGMDPQQQRIMLFMPLMFGFMFYGQSSGLVLYWLVGNLVALAQQWAFNKFIK